MRLSPGKTLDQPISMNFVKSSKANAMLKAQEADRVKSGTVAVTLTDLALKIRPPPGS
jgi:hypothetical protein